MTNYFVLLGKEYIGPMDKKKIESWLKDGRITVENPIYSYETKTFSYVGELPDMERHIPRQPLTKPEADIFFVAFGKETVGPFDEGSIRSLLRERTLTPFNYLYHYNKKKWQIIKEYSQFQDDLPPFPKRGPDYDPEKGVANTILLDKDWIGKPLYGEHVRQFPRIDYAASATVTLPHGPVSGRCVQIGEGGCLIEMDIKHVSIGDIVTLKISPDIIKLGLASIAKVVHIDPVAPSSLAFEFQGLPEVVRKEIREVVKEILKAP